jgi:predicted GTPase
VEELIAEHDIECCVFSYSDVAHEDVMHKAALVNACGADFKMLGERETQVKSTKPVISICAVRTGCGKSQTTRRISEILQAAGKKVVAIRHPMPYGDLAKQAVQRFATIDDLKKHECTIEEMEEYEPHISRGNVIYAGVDYEAILREAEKEADVILWDGGNNDTPFYKPDLHVVVADPHRAGHEISYYPGETNIRLADIVIINKAVEAQFDHIEEVRENVRSINPDCVIIDAASPLTIDKPELIAGKNVLVVEDGPTLTHGGMSYGAGVVAALRSGAAELVDPRPWVTGKLAETFEIYPEIGTLLPAMGYGDEQVADLEKTINKVECDAVVIGTPIDLNRIVKIKKPTVRVGYDLQEIGRPNLVDLLEKFTK